MQCAVVSRAGQVLANVYLLPNQNEAGEWRLDLQTDGGRLIEGGMVGSDGDLTSASQVLFRQFFEVWRMSGSLEDE
jgi:hypothetical protein